MNKWTYSENAQKMANDELEQLGIFQLPDKSLFHYTSREVFWLIMESETLLARHIMFSNDCEENMIGTNKIAQAMKSVGIQPKETDALPFMVCFCKQGDLLSQWRGYAKEGVSLEFDFSKGLYGFKDGFSSYYCYTVMNNKEENKYLSKDLMSDDEIFVGAIVSPYSVIYIGNTGRSNQKLKGRMQKIMTAPEDSRQQYAVGMIPYIKNNKFYEEKEYRLIFDMKQLVPETQQHLLHQKYVYLDVDGIKKPNIRVKFGNQLQAEEETIKVYYANEDWTRLLEKLKQDLKSERIDITLVKDEIKYPMDKNEIVISNGKFQEKVCVKLRLMMWQQTPPIRDFKIWCDGHLPIRRVIVGPSKDAELMKCSIEEYVKTKYWMRDIEVDISVIPLRT